MSSEQMTAIAARGLGKRYLIYEKPHHRLLQGILRKPMHRAFWALQEVDFSVARGEAVGIIGKNGSGKSTLLQILCGILPPTTGDVQISGRIAALLELGAGFNPEFTGRENAYVVASLLGLPRPRIDQVLPEILAFAEIGEHIDQPVKTYSSGMFLRLAFAVAVHCDPDILVVDEALAVGDVYFQAKCHRRIRELRSTGCTLLFVTHSVEALSELCDRGLVLDAGRLVYDGAVKPAIAEYLRRVFGGQTHARAMAGESRPDTVAPTALGALRADTWLAAQGGDRFAERGGYNPAEIRVGNGRATICDFAFDGQVNAQPVFDLQSRATLWVRYRAEEACDRLVYGMQLRTGKGELIYSTNSFLLSGDLHSAACGVDMLASFSFNLALLPGSYSLTVGLAAFNVSGEEIEVLDRRIDGILVTIIGLQRRAVGVADLDAAIAVPDMTSERSAPVCE